jgi:hypothetical protein
VPNLPPKDNVVQTLAVLGATAVGAIIGCALARGTVIAWPTHITAIVRGIGGMILGTLVSGLVLWVLGWIRSTR